MDEATRCDRLILLREGRILADTTPTRLLVETGAEDAEAAFLSLIEGDREVERDGGTDAPGPAARHTGSSADGGAR